MKHKRTINCFQVKKEKNCAPKRTKIISKKHVVAYDFSQHFSKNLSLFLFCQEAKLNFLMLRCDDFRSIIKKKSEKHMISADATEVNF